MDKSQIDLVEPQRFAINFTVISSPMTVRTKSDEVVILMSLRLCPRDNVMNVDLDVSASGNSAAVAGFNKDPAANVSRYWRASSHD